MAAGANETVVIVHVAHAVIFAQRIFQFGTKRVVRRVSEPENVGAESSKVNAEKVIIGGKMRR
jgi:hypothetical protein